MSAEIKLSRRRFLKGAAVVGGVAALSVLGTAANEAHRFAIERVRLHLPHLPPSRDGLRLAQISDLHFGDYLHEPYFRGVVEAINRESVDVALLTGDYITADSFLFGKGPDAARLAWSCAQVLAGIRTTYGCFAVLGNHDIAAGAEEVTSALGANGCTVLCNRSLPIENGRDRLWLAGVDDVAKGRPDLDQALLGIPPNECVVLAVHEPDYADQVRGRNVDLQLSGHSHGGQVRLPIVGAPILPSFGKKYPMGYYRLGKLQLYTNRGIGVIDLPVRFLCAPEITISTLHRG
jgi:predicted MPP superfamily phosphohydrolase